MTACELCSARHATSECVTGLAYIEQCFTGTPGDYVALPSNVVSLPMFRGEARRAVQHWSQRIKTNEGLTVARLG